MRKNTTIQRLHIINGQVDGLINLLEKQEDCNSREIFVKDLNEANARAKMLIELKEMQKYNDHQMLCMHG